MDCPWFLICGLSDGRWWWDHIADQAMHHEWHTLMNECNEWRAKAPHAVDADILASWSMDDMVGAGATVTLRNPEGYLTDRDGPCAWDGELGPPPPWWTDGMPTELVRRVNGMTLRISRAHHGWAYGPMLREYYVSRP